MRRLRRTHFCVQWWFINPDTFVPGQYFQINDFSGLLNRPSVLEWKSVPARFVRISEISGARINESSLYYKNANIYIEDLFLMANATSNSWQVPWLCYSSIESHFDGNYGLITVSKRMANWINRIS